MNLTMNGIKVDIADDQVAECVRRQLLAQQMETRVVSAGFASLGIPKIGEPWPEEGGVYAGVARGLDGKPDYHLILATHDEAESVKWEKAKKWAAGLVSPDGIHRDYTLPSRKEQALLLANVAEHFQSAWYWSSEQHAGTDAYAWVQTFCGGTQLSTRKASGWRARAVRRLAI